MKQLNVVVGLNSKQETTRFLLSVEMRPFLSFRVKRGIVEARKLEERIAENISNLLKK